jgi:hypothetical protein
LERVKLIPDAFQRIFMDRLLTYGFQDFNKNIEVVEQDSTGDFDDIIDKIMINY